MLEVQRGGQPQTLNLYITTTLVWMVWFPSNLKCGCTVCQRRMHKEWYPLTVNFKVGGYTGIFTAVLYARVQIHFHVSPSLSLH